LSDKKENQQNNSNTYILTDDKSTFSPSRFLQNNTIESNLYNKNLRSTEKKEQIIKNERNNNISDIRMSIDNSYDKFNKE